MGGTSKVLVGRETFEDGIDASTSRPRAEVNQAGEGCFDAPAWFLLAPRAGQSYLDEKATVEVAGQEFFLKSGWNIAALDELLLAGRGATLEVKR